MNQAEGLMQDLSSSPREPVRVISITSGKGGVGKSNLVANLAYHLSQMGQRVLVLDADLGLANMDVLLGLTPTATLYDVLMGQCRLADILVTGPGGMKIVPASSGVSELTALNDEQRLFLVNEFDDLETECDVVLLDTGAGISDNVLYFNVAAQEILVVATPEPTSITDAYATMKVLATRFGEKVFKLVVNEVVREAEAREVYRRLSLVAERFLNIRIDYLGHVLKDPDVEGAVRQQRLLSEVYPGSKAARCFAKLAQTIMRTRPESEPKGAMQFFWRRFFEIRP